MFCIFVLAMYKLQLSGVPASKVQYLSVLHASMQTQHAGEMLDSLSPPAIFVW